MARASLNVRTTPASKAASIAVERAFSGDRLANGNAMSASPFVTAGLTSATSARARVRDSLVLRAVPKKSPGEPGRNHADEQRAR